MALDDSLTYGFPVPEYIDANSYSSFVNHYNTILLRRQTRWENISINSNTKSRKLKRFIRKGIPQTMRSDLWMKLSGAQEDMKNNAGLYESLLTQESDPGIAKVISADIPRTFPQNTLFRNPKTSPSKEFKAKQLKNILTAFSIQNKSIGYCQGLNYVAALILIVIPTEEEAFWLFNTLVMKILQSYYSIKMEALQVDCLVLQELIKRKVPRVYKKMQEMETNCVVMCSAWFICIYIDILPVETAMRIIDCMVYEGDKVIFRVGLTLIQLFEKEFLASESFPEFAMCFKKIVANKTVLDCHNFMQKCFKRPDPLSYKLLDKLRKQCQQKLESQDYN